VWSVIPHIMCGLLHQCCRRPPRSRCCCSSSSAPWRYSRLRSDVFSMVLHRCLSCATRSASTTVNPLASQSFFTESIHIFLGLLLLLHPFTRPCMAMYGKRFWFILATWPKKLSHLNSTFSTMSLFIFKLLRMTSFLTRSCLVTPAMRLRQLISKTLKLLFNSAVSVHVSSLYSSMLRTRVSYTLTLVLGLMSLDLHILINRFNASQAKPTLLSTSGFELPSSSNFPPW